MVFSVLACLSAITVVQAGRMCLANVPSTKPRDCQVAVLNTSVSGNTAGDNCKLLI